MAVKVRRARARATSTDSENTLRVLDDVDIDDLTGDITLTIVTGAIKNDGNDTHIFISEEPELGFAKEFYIFSEDDTGPHVISLVSGSSIKQVIVILEDNDSYTQFRQEVRFDPFQITPIKGDKLANVLVGTDLGDAVYGREGNDVILGLEGENSLYGWQDNDLIIGGSRADVLIGSSGNDSLYGGASLNNFVYGDVGPEEDYREANSSTFSDGGSGDDLIEGGSKRDELYGGQGKDKLWGGLNIDSLYGEAGQDLLDGSAGSDSMYGGSGDDTFIVDNFGDRAYENADEGIDTVISSVNYYLDIEGGEGAGSTPVDRVVENLILEGLNPLNGEGNSLDNTIIGNAGNTYLSGGGGNDLLVGDNSRSASGGVDLIFGDTGDDALVGGKNIDTLWGGSGADAFVFLSPNHGLDEVRDFQFSEGDKIYVSLKQFGNIAGDYSQFSYNSFTRTLSFQGIAFARFQEGVNFIPTLDIVLTNNLPSTFASLPTVRKVKSSGTTRADRLIGREQADQMRGGKGDDLIAGLEGNDVLFGEDGNDTIDGGTNEDTLNGGTGGDRVFGEFGNDLIIGEDGNDRLQGGRDEDIILGGRDNDTLYGGEDNDTLTGGSGQDWFMFYRPANIDVNVIRDDAGNLVSVCLDLASYTESKTLPNSSISSDRFYIGKAANTEFQNIIYDDTTGALYFDYDGTGSARQVQIASLPIGIPLSASQILAWFSGGTPVVDHKPYSDGVDWITDFNVNDDAIGIYVGTKMVSAYHYAELEPNAVLKKSQFKVGARATTAAHRFIYDDRNGNLYFDRDGTGSLAPVQIAKLDQKPALSYKNIHTFNDAKADQLNLADVALIAAHSPA